MCECVNARVIRRLLFRSVYAEFFNPGGATVVRRGFLRVRGANFFVILQESFMRAECKQRF